MCLNLSILYRGTLSSCNYDCPYCPFAKHWESSDELAADREGLERFSNWIERRADDRFAVFFTPWGEALVRSWYREAIVQLSQTSHVHKVAVQTNLSCQLDWLRAADTSKLGFWCTYHPGQTTLSTFLKQCERLSELGVNFSVGCVGRREHLPAIERLRRDLPPDIYVWVNAYKSEGEYSDQSLFDALATIDPLFPINNAQHESHGRPCRTGHSVITVDSSGDVRRCHFVDRVIGNIYAPGFAESLRPSTCPNTSCGCHIGYVHLEHLNLDRVFGDTILERIPLRAIAKQAPSALSSFDHSRPTVGPPDDVGQVG